MLTTVWLLALLGVAAGGAVAQLAEGHRAPGPAPGPAPAPSPVHRLTLDNGVEVLLVRRAGLPFVAAGWAVRAGSADDPPGARGTAHLVEHLLHQGSETLGTSDWPRERRLLERQEDLVDRLEAARRDGSGSGAQDAARRLSELHRELTAIQRKGEAAAWAARGGITAIDALTEPDFSIYWAQVPLGQLELWFWLESDRLAAPVFRDFYSELQVVAEELAQRVASRPGGPAEAEFDALFWPRVGVPGYAWPAGGLAEEIAALRPRDARGFFDRHYRPDRLLFALVGDVDPELVHRLADVYLGRLAPRGPAPPSRRSEASTESGEAPGPVVLERSCRCRARVELRWPSAAAGDDEEALYDLLAGVLNGRTGRLHRSLVEQREIAFAAYALHASRGLAGSLRLTAEALESTSAAGEPEAELAQLQQALLTELRRVAEHGVTADELTRVRRRLMTEHASQLEPSQGLLLRLLARRAVAEAAGEDRVWRRGELLDGVDPAAVQALATRLVRLEPSVLRLRREEAPS